MTTPPTTAAREALGRRATGLVLLVVLAAGAGGLAGFARPGDPRAAARVVLATAGPDRDEEPAVRPAAAALAAVARSDAVLGAAATALRGKGSDVDERSLRDRVDVRADATGLLVTATARTPAQARARADAVVAAYRRVTATALRRRADAAARAAGDAGVAAALRGAAAAAGDGVLVADPARDLPGRRPVLWALAAGTAAGVLGVLAAMVRSGRGGLARAERLAADAGVALAGAVRRRPVPAVQGLAAPGSPAALAAESAAAVLDAALPAPARGVRTLLVVPARARRGPGTGAVELAAACARLGHPTVLVRLAEYPVGTGPRGSGSRAIGPADGTPQVVVGGALRAAPDVTVLHVAGSPAGTDGRGPVDLDVLCRTLPGAVEVVVVHGAALDRSGVTVQVAADVDAVVVEADRRATRADVRAAVDRARAACAPAVALLARPGGVLGSVWAWAQADLHPVPALEDRPVRAPLTPARHPNRAGADLGGAKAGWWSPQDRTPAGR